MTFTRRTALAGLFAVPLAGFQINDRSAPWSERLIAAARAQIGVTRLYDGAYASLGYPGGDVPRERGVCTDVVVRAYRDAFGFDLQSAVHKDMRDTFGAYPAIWGLSRPDRNIDHRRVPNLETFLRRQGAEHRANGWQPGDLMTCRLPGNLPHIAIVSDRRGLDRNWKIIHNIGQGTEETSMPVIYDKARRFRFAPPALASHSEG